MDIRTTAKGPCIQCGQESEGSVYWLAMSDDNWKALAPFVGAGSSLYGGEDLRPEERAMNTYFVEGICEPFCDPKCSLEFHHGNQD